MKRVISITGVLLLLACSDEPGQNDITMPPQPALVADVAEPLKVAVFDVLERVLPTLSGDTEALRAELLALVDDVATADRIALDARIARVSAQLSVLEADAVDIAPLTLLLDQTRSLARKESALTARQ